MNLLLYLIKKMKYSNLVGQTIVDSYKDRSNYSLVVKIRLALGWGGASMGFPYMH
jgi:hypothetical protein